MTSQDKWLLGLRIIALICVVAMVALVEGSIESSGVRAPLLTMVGSAAVIMMIFPMDRTSTIQVILRDMGTIIGTGSVMYGGVRWLEDAVQRGPGYDAPAALSMIALLLFLLGIYLLLSVLTFVDWGNIIGTATRKIMRR